MRIALWFTLLLCISACGPKVIYNQKLIIKDGKWVNTDIFNFSFEIIDDKQEYDIFLHVSHDEKFEYQNLYVKIKTVFPDKKSTEDIVSLEMSDGTGKSYGKCSGDQCETAIQLQSKVKFKQKGKHELFLNQYSRAQMVEGIESLTLKIIEVKSE
ncbi:MAG: hypothetical protein RLZZ546_337 [Bacteroidota bacterium]|jgi:gliding motility-associated lipoprotein GldH